MIKLIFVFFLPFLLSFFFSFLLYKFCLKYKIALQRPRPRDLHIAPTPRLGGIGLFFAFSLSVALFYYLFGIKEIPLIYLAALILGSLLVVGIMVLDDLFGLSPWIKLVGQFLVALIPVIFGVRLAFVRIPFHKYLNLETFQIEFTLFGYHLDLFIYSALLIIFWLILLMNALNFLDGLDGLAASISALSALVIAGLSFSKIVNQSETGYLAIITAGVCLGFLPLNWHKAKIFLGDAGAMFLGFILGLLSVISGSKVATLSLVLGVAILDALLVVIGRLLRGKNPFTTPDQSHLHHRLLKAGFSVPQAVFIYLFLSGLIGASAIFANANLKGLMFILLLVAFFFLDRLLKVKDARHLQR